VVHASKSPAISRVRIFIANVLPWTRFSAGSMPAVATVFGRQISFLFTSLSRRQVSRPFTLKT